MAKNLIQNGDRVTQKVAAAVVSGELYALGAGAEVTSNGLPAIAAKSGGASESVDFIVNGVWEITKINEAGSGLQVGSTVYWRKVGNVAHVTGLAAGAEGIAGTAWASAADGATTAFVKLLEQAGKAATP